MFQSPIVVISVIGGLRFADGSAGLQPIGPRAGVIYCRLFKYTQQHTADFTQLWLGYQHTH
jgi:hypothetical protein